MWQPSLSPHRCSAPSRSESCPSGQPNGYPCLSLGSPLRLSASPLAASPPHHWPPLRLTTGRLSASPLAASPPHHWRPVMTSPLPATPPRAASRLPSPAPPVPPAP